MPTPPTFKMTEEHRQLVAQFRQAVLDDVQYTLDIMNFVNNGHALSDTQKAWKASQRATRDYYAESA